MTTVLGPGAQCCTDPDNHDEDCEFKDAPAERDVPDVPVPVHDIPLPEVVDEEEDQ